MNNNNESRKEKKQQIKRKMEMEKESVVKLPLTEVTKRSYFSFILLFLYVLHFDVTRHIPQLPKDPASLRVL